MYPSEEIRASYEKRSNAKIWMMHHLELNPKICNSGCRLKKEDFYWFIENNKNYVSFLDLVEGKCKVDGKSVLTFDDGLADMYNIAYPYFKKNNIPFTMFIVTNFIDQPGYLTKEQLIEMSKDPLVTIGGHGTNHKILTKIKYDEQVEEIKLGKETLEKIIGKKVEIFAYSHGSFNDEIIGILKDSGYKYALTTEEYAFVEECKKEPYIIPRFNIDNNSIDKYKMKN